MSMEKATTNRDPELFECQERNLSQGAEIHRLKGRVRSATQIALGLGGALVLATGALIGSWVAGSKRSE